MTNSIEVNNILCAAKLTLIERQRTGADYLGAQKVVSIVFSSVSWHRQVKLHAVVVARKK